MGPDPGDGLQNLHVVSSTTVVLLFCPTSSVTGTALHPLLRMHERVPCVRARRWSRPLAPPTWPIGNPRSAALRHEAENNSSPYALLRDACYEVCPVKITLP